MCSDDVKNSKEVARTKGAINVSQVGKCFQIYSRPSDRLKQMLVRDGRQFFREFWALKNVSFSVERGETVGIIGRNGSGKSTLLQIICGTLSPTVGDVKVQGKVAALLELGAGFNPEFTGLENIYMAASIYGLNKLETEERLSKILAFADIGEHVEQPVKTYSSGMYVRLAFAVIAHVDADILIIDEALAVGDAVFTQKCMRFIRTFRENGTLLFVSHDMNSVLSLCDRAVWLNKGEIVEEGDAKAVAENYLKSTLQDVYGEDAELESLAVGKDDKPDDEQSYPSVEPLDTRLPNSVDYQAQMQFDERLNEANGWKTGSGEIVSVGMLLASGEEASVLRGGESVCLMIEAIANERLEQPILGFLVRDKLGQDLFGENTLIFTDLKPTQVDEGESFSAKFTFQLPMLPNGQYVVMASLADGDLYNHIQHHWLHDALILTVSSSLVRWGLVGLTFENVQLNKNT